VVTISGQSQSKAIGIIKEEWPTAIFSPQPTLAMPRTDFETPQHLDGENLTIGSNDAKSTAQANETYVVRASQQQPLGDTGEQVGFAKKAEGYNEATQQLRMEKAAELNKKRGKLAEKPAVDSWQRRLKQLEEVDKTLSDSQSVLKANQDRLASLNAGVPRDEAEIQKFTKRVADNQVEVDMWQGIQDNKQGIRQQLATELAENPEIAEYLKVSNELKAAQNLVSSYSNIASSSSNLYEDDISMMQGESLGDRGLVTRSVASHELDQLFGTGVVAQEKFATSEEHGLMGVSVQCDGVGVRSQPGTANELGEPQTAFLDIDYSEPAIQKGLSDLEVMDYISGQIDRHPGNIFIEPKSGKVTGIDNDLAFPEVEREQMLGRERSLQTKAVAGKPQMIHRETAEKLLKVSPDEMREKLKGIRPPDGGPGLSDAQIEGAVKRLEAMQAAIRNPQPGQPPQIVDAFNTQTYEQQAAVQAEAQEKAVAAGETANATSYLGSVLAEVEYARNEQAQGNSMYVERDLDTVGKARRDPAYEEYAAKVESAAQENKAQPQKIADPAKRAEVTDLKKQVDDANAKVAHYEKELAKLEKGRFGARLRSLASGGPEARKEFYENKKAQAKQQLGSLERQLDHAARESVSSSTKQGLMQDARANAQDRSVAQNQAAQNAKAPKVGGAGYAPPIEQRVPLNQLPPPVGKNAAQVNAGNSINAAEDEQDVDLLDALDDLDEDEVELKQEGLKKSPSVRDMLNSSNGTSLGSHRQAQAKDQEQGQGQEGPKPGGKTLRSSGSWQAAKPTALKTSGSSLSTSR